MRLPVRRDVVITPPPAIWGRGRDPFAGIDFNVDPPTPQEIIQAQAVEIRHLTSELMKLKVTANTIANVAAYLIFLREQDSLEGADGEVRVSLFDRMVIGDRLKLTCGKEGDEIVARYSLRAPDHSWITRTEE